VLSSCGPTIDANRGISRISLFEKLKVSYLLQSVPEVVLYNVLKVELFHNGDVAKGLRILALWIVDSIDN